MLTQKRTKKRDELLNTGYFLFIYYSFVYKILDATSQTVKQTEYKLLNAYIDTKGQVCRLLSSTNKTK